MNEAVTPPPKMSRSLTTLHARVRVVADLAVCVGGASTAVAAVYWAVAIQHGVETMFEPEFPGVLRPFDPAAITDPVTAAAITEVGADAVREIDQWVLAAWPDICVSAEALVAVWEALPLNPGCTAEQCAYRRAGREIAAEAGESCVDIVWAGTCAETKWLRMYAGRDNGNDSTELEVEPVVAAAQRELDWDRSTRVAIWVNEPATWARIDARAEEILAKLLIAATGEVAK
ncbi:hypothetical protein C5U48_02590 [Mycolicibacter virginiensis]|uniref:Uncharacterized protein n=1 Tax=Mycolicibacter virginiensis TaxID=1795032 RepID=A0A9X7IQW3_9MYCO|nr:hypothetical protein [Mycolicibacter virginiensis]PQM53717.1 hypothetical protein C5U48_02590 [Mycolicibacter virginiensis]